MLPPHRTLLATLVLGFMTTVYADDTTNTLPTISIQAEQDQTDTYVATQATSALKSDAPLFKTAQSVSVITQEQLEQKQAQTLAEAIDGVAGVDSTWLEK